MGHFNQRQFSKRRRRCGNSKAKRGLDTGFYREIGLEIDKDENIVYDENTLETPIPGLFVAGDISLKEKLIAPAMYQGFKAASSVLMYNARKN